MNAWASHTYVHLGVRNSTSSVVMPDEARRLAAELTAAADQAERHDSTVCPGWLCTKTREELTR